MCEQGLELISTNTLSLKLEEQSSVVVVTDDIEGNAYFTFKVEKVESGKKARTLWNAVDEFHADVIIEIQPDSVTRFPNPIDIGTYHKDRRLYMGVVVQPAAPEEDLYNVIVSFYTNKIGYGNN